MKNLNKFFTVLFGVIALSAVMFSFAACKEPEAGPEFPNGFGYGNEWYINKHHDMIRMIKYKNDKGWFNEIEVYLFDDKSKHTFNLKEVTSIESQNYYQFTFKELGPAEAVTAYVGEPNSEGLREGFISMVNFNIIQPEYRGGPDQWMVKGTLYPHNPPWDAQR